MSFLSQRTPALTPFALDLKFAKRASARQTRYHRTIAKIVKFSIDRAASIIRL